jgi:hypothetical protein
MEIQSVSGVEGSRKAYIYFMTHIVNNAAFFAANSAILKFLLSHYSLLASVYRLTMRYVVLFVRNLYYCMHPSMINL